MMKLMKAIGGCPWQRKVRVILPAISTTIAAAIFPTPDISAMSSVQTAIVGQLKLTIGGTGGIGTSAITVLGAPLENKLDSAGNLTAVSGTSLTNGSAAWTPGAFAATHYVQITSGASLGVCATILDNTETVLTTATDISSLLTGNESYVVRAYTTLSDVFGAANESGLGSGSSAFVADEVLIYDGTGFDVYYYQQGAAVGGDGWRTAINAFDDQSAAPLPIGSSIIVKRKQVDNLELVIAGSLLMTDSVIPVETGVNWLSGASPIEYTLASYFGASGGDLVKAANPTLADEILIPTADGGFDIYYYQQGAANGGDGFRSSTDVFTDASGAIIAEIGKGFVIKRKGVAYNQTDESPVD